MKKLILVLTVIICCSCNAQQKKDSVCYKNSRGFIENKLPNDICVKKDEMIYSLFNKFDFNNDGLTDVAIEKGNKNLKDGNQTDLVIYEKINDSTYTKFRALNNVYPIWFDVYDSSVKLDDSALNDIKEYYEMGDPLRVIELVENKIILNLKGDAVTDYILTFTYLKEKKDWILSKYIEFDLNNNVKKPYSNDRLNTSISDFSYLEFLNGEY